VQGAAESTASYLLTVVLAMVQFPDVQRKAQEEIDRVVGIHRMPTLEDFEHMPYIQAIIYEVFQRQSG